MIRPSKPRFATATGPSVQNVLDSHVSRAHIGSFSKGNGKTPRRNAAAAARKRRCVECGGVLQTYSQAYCSACADERRRKVRERSRQRRAKAGAK